MGAGTGSRSRCDPTEAWCGRRVSDDRHVNALTGREPEKGGSWGGRGSEALRSRVRVVFVRIENLRTQRRKSLQWGSVRHLARWEIGPECHSQRVAKSCGRQLRDSDFGWILLGIREDSGLGCGRSARGLSSTSSSVQSE